MPQPDSMTRLLDDLAPLLQRHGFRPRSDRAEWTGKFSIRSWERRSWKLDQIRVLWRVGPPSACLLDAQWSVSVDGGEHLASGLNAIHARRRINQVDLPTAWPVVGAWLEARWRAALVADAEHGIAWCDRCATRAGALADLARPDRNGPQAGSAAYRAIERYVLDHAPP